MRNIERRMRRPFGISNILRVLIVAGFYASPADGQASSSQAQAGVPTRLGDLYAQVARANPKIVAARALSLAAQTRVPGAARLPDPALQFGVMNYDLAILAPMSTLGMTQLQLMQTVPTGGKLGLAGRVAASRASAADAQADDVGWALRTQTAMAFYDLYAADRTLAVQQETLRILEDVERTAESMYRVGEGRQTDVLRAQVEIAKMTEDTLRTRATRETMVARLNALLDRDGSTAVGELALPRLPDSLPSRTWLDSVAFSERPMIRTELDNVRAAELSEALARKQIWPDVQLGVQYAQRGGAMGPERMGSLMFGASIPVFAHDRQLKMRDEAAAMKQMARADLATARAETRGKIGEAYANLAAARTLSQLYRTTVLPQAEATVTSALGAYRVGRVDFMTLLDDRMTLNKYLQERNALEAEQGKAWAELEMLVGRELFDANQVTTTIVATGGAR